MSQLERYSQPPARLGPGHSLAPSASSAQARPMVLECGVLPSEVARLLNGRELDVVSASDPEQALRLLNRMSPIACFVSGTLDGGDPATLIARIGKRYRPPPCIVVLDDDTWLHADDCRAAGAVDVVHSGEWLVLLEALRVHAPHAFSRAARAEAVLPLVATVGGETYAVESTDLRETGIALRGFPDIPVGRMVRLRLDIEGNEVWLRGEVARVFERDGARLVAVRFVGLGPELQSWVGRIIAELQARGPAAFELECWRAEIRLTIAAAFDTRPQVAECLVASVVPPRPSPRVRPPHGWAHKLRTWLVR